MRFEVVYEDDAAGACTASVRELPGCVAVGETHEECERNVREAIWVHLARVRREPVGSR
jgi:predicted RNase H-like HicB family nuclease